MGGAGGLREALMSPRETHAAARTTRTTLCPLRVGGVCGQHQCHHSADGTSALPAAVITAWVTWTQGQSGREGACLGTCPCLASESQAPFSCRV